MMRRILITFFIISALLAWALTAPEITPPIEAVPEAAAVDLPAYHLPSRWWRTRHGSLVARAGRPYERYISQGECRQCHQMNTDCQACHGYVGVRVELEGE